jgi:hypothetical protein
MGVNRVKTIGLCSCNWLSFKDFVELHKLTVFTCDMAKKQASYMMSSTKNPIKMTIHQHTMHMEVLNGYIMYLPTLKDSVMAVAFAEKGNKPFNKATLVGMIMATCPIAWRNQFNLTHKTIPKSPRTMLPDLKNIKKVFIKKYNKKGKPRPTRPRLQQPPRLVKHTCPGSTQMGVGLIESLRRAIQLSIAAGGRLMEGPIQPMIQSSVANMRRMKV